MKHTHTNIAIFSITLLVFFSVFMVDTNNKETPGLNQAKSIPNNSAASLLTPITTPLIIDGFATGVDANNWSKAVQDGWVTGQGTPDDPYLITGIAVNTTNQGNALTIQNSKSVTFLINDSQFVAGEDYSALELSNTVNGTIANSTFASSKHGILLKTRTMQNTFSNNKVIENAYGIYFGSMSMGNMFMSNGITENSIMGIFSEITASNNMMAMNYFLNNPIHAEDNSSTGNIWNLTMMGNFWDDYAGEDNDTDFIGDEPYAINGTIQDFLPMFNHDPMIMPIRNLSYVYESAGNIVNWTVMDMASYGAYYEIYQNGVLISSAEDWNPEEIIIDIDGLEIGYYNFTLVVFDGLGGMNSNQIDVSVVNDNDLMYVFIGLIVVFVGIILFVKNRKG